MRGTSNLLVERVDFCRRQLLHHETGSRGRKHNGMSACKECFQAYENNKFRPVNLHYVSRSS
jgi:hypothetical protein